MLMNKDWKGNSNSIYKTLGATNHTEKEREENDFYATDPIAIDKLLTVEKFSHSIWECACGEGHLAKRLIDFGYDVHSTDLVYRGFGIGGQDFLQYKDGWHGDIITNPPYSYAKEFVENALLNVQNGDKVAMFLKLQFLEGKARRKLFDINPPARIHVFSERVMCAKNAKFEEMKAGGGSAVAYAWYIWEKGFKGKTTIDWI